VTIKIDRKSVAFGDVIVQLKVGHTYCPSPIFLPAMNFILLNVCKDFIVSMSVPVAVRSKAWVCGRSLAGIVGSNPTAGHRCLSVVSIMCCQIEVSVTS